MSTRIPFPTARSAVPMAAVVFPLPGPVLIRMRPRRDGSCVFKICCSRCLDGMSLMAGVVWVACEDCKCAIELFGEHQARQCMRKGETAKRKQQCCAFSRIL